MVESSAKSIGRRGLALRFLALPLRRNASEKYLPLLPSPLRGPNNIPCRQCSLRAAAMGRISGLSFHVVLETTLPVFAGFHEKLMLFPLRVVRLLQRSSGFGVEARPESAVEGGGNPCVSARFDAPAPCRASGHQECENHRRSSARTSRWPAVLRLLHAIGRRDAAFGHRLLAAARP